MAPEKAVASFIDFRAIDNSHLAPFDHSGIYDPTLTPFPPTRPAATRLARARQTYSGKVHSHRPLVFARAGEATEGIRHVE